MTQKEFETEWRTDSDRVVCHTSGSTGTPKEIMLPKELMRESARRTNDFFGIDSDSRLHSCLDFRYIGGKMLVVRADEAGCRLTSETPSNRPLGEIEKEERIDLLSVVPSQMQWILDSETKWTDIKQILIGGSAIPSGQRRRIALSPYKVWESYGMTETASHIALREVTEDTTSPFRTMHGITVELADNGCLTINMPGAGKIKTNDIAEVYSPEEFLILGRADHCIISGGIKILPEEIERKLGGFIAFDYCIASVPDPKWGEKAVLVFETDEVDDKLEFIKKAVGRRLEMYRKSLELGVKAPKEAIGINRIPKTANGKIDRNMLHNIFFS